ncbi:MAG: DinB family protein [Gemmatimonadota bacterium]|nr:DinB family protein [Gemmatimonadota bacterium]
MSNSEPTAVQIHSLRVRLTGAFPTMMRTAIAPFDDESIWWQPAPGINPVAVLALHCAGNLRHYIGHFVGGTDYVRNRPQEFDATRRLTKKEVVDEFDRAIEDVRRAMDDLKPVDYTGPSRNQENPQSSLYEDFMVAVTHLALHTGQAVQLAKLHGYSVGDKVWGDAHRTAAAQNG